MAILGSAADEDEEYLQNAVKEPSFRAEYFEDLYNLESGSFWFRCRNKLIVWGLRKYFGTAKSFLEVGCGTGFVLTAIQKNFPDLKITGSELFREGLEYAYRRLAGVELLELDARKMPFSGHFDVVGAFDVLEHIDEDEVVLRELWKACNSGIILTVPQHMFLWSSVDDLACHKRRYSAQELVTKVEAAGFSVLHVTSFVSFLMPLLLVSRWSKGASRSESQSELKLPSVLDSILELICDFEQVLIRSGIRMPLGGSLLVIANKGGELAN
ncbi:MAG: hypothetical protein QG574_4394 [Cyanobacteriota bacterium erpe_2018_sw_21hr_WHONDRS-SW48-000092_B_bin.40]|jgi:hypothetical protein|nr:hypothetical protein [Cyanobacteriota bacterium erpe_2018_sw_21hr_WHONDRS-SW48-000092_B_bin.40]